ncbi:MAG TPA: gliding motility protein GldN, partial [Chitinophagales bacterium]|nr:gliding motility protein GldN [Chitinophagales bacterium]
QDIDQLPWQQQNRKDMKPLPYEYVREADAMWSKNIWRVIDTRQKMNLPFGYPQKPLIQIIHEAAKKGEITVYDPAVDYADQFKKVLALSDVAKIGSSSDTSIQVDPENPDREISVLVKNELTWDKIKKFRVKEVWYFDTKLSAMQVRIIGIAPVMEDYDAAGNYRGDMTMYWIPYASLRDMLAKEEVFNPYNDTQHYSWEDLLEMRKFQSYIYKESNVFDRNIQEYTAGIDAQLESDRIKQQMFEYEHDMWNY